MAPLTDVWKPIGAIPVCCPRGVQFAVRRDWRVALGSETPTPVGADRFSSPTCSAPSEGPRRITDRIRVARDPTSERLSRASRQMNHVWASELAVLDMCCHLG